MTDRIPHAAPAPAGAARPDRYKWVALSNTTLGMFMAMVDGSIVIISLPAIFRGIGLDPFAPGNISYLLWIIMGYLLVTAVLVVTLGRLGDIVGRVRIYNLGFVVFTLASLILSLDPAHGAAGALWLILWRLVQAVGGAMLMANSAAIITDAFPAEQRGMALGVNQISALAGQFIGLVLGGVLSVWDWHSVFWINVPFGVFGTVWAYRSLHELSERRPATIDWWGNLSFAGGCALLLAAITYGIQPYGGHSMGWTSPMVLGGLALGVALLLLFGYVEKRVPQPMFRLSLFRNRAFAAGNAAALLASVARGGMQFMLIIWLQGIWLPLHGYDYADTPLWAGIFLLPLTAGFLLAGPMSGYLSDRYGVFYFTTGGLTLFAFSFVGLLFLPLNFPYWAFALLIMLNGFGSGMFSAPNTSAIMSSVPAEHRGAASGMRSTFQNSGMSLSIGIFFTLLITGLSGRLPGALFAGLTAQGVPAAAAQHAAQLPAVSTVFSAFLGTNPMQTALGPTGVLAKLSPQASATITGKTFFPNLISGPFHHGLMIVFGTAACMALLAATASLLRGATPRAGQAPAQPRTAAERGESVQDEVRQPSS